MSSYILKSVVGNEFDQVVKDLGFGDTADNDDDHGGTGMSAAEVIAEQKRQRAAEEERRTRHAKIEKEREEARQKIRDKYNIKKKDEPATTRKGAHEPARPTPPPPPPPPSAPAPAASSTGFDAVKMTTNAFNSIKAKFGWK